ncbi:hypothetical protein CLV62_10277 [Dysgonomonas alginatilytica]|uniref:Uncharacterized protein n=1 Tax=Dysgonomonas alginatilytica TaxID=1605892 RepID=A0A2V3PS75_9BACT|nr:hypothetical protein [Dysgonomonas alginatilytica]PXV68047.1 hypothetical protein CLV62_10277 [Dysgonomonas alginatilytica]
MKKLLIIIIVCLATSVVYSQDPYRLDKVVLSVRDYDSKALVFEKSLNDSVQIISSEWNFPLIPVFKSVTLEGDRISSGELLDNGNRYNLDRESNVLTLLEALPEKEEIAGSSQEEKKVTETISGSHIPEYTIRQSGNQLTITFDQIIYGSSNYPGQTLKGKCEMIYVKP